MNDLKAAKHHPDSTSLNAPPSCILRQVSTPNYHGLERRSRPRFIEADLTIQTLINGEPRMKHYSNVKNPVGAAVHALYDGETATACGAVNAADTEATTSAVSCDACMKAIINQQRASDHRMPLVPGEAKPVLHHNFSTHEGQWRRAICAAMEAAKTEAERSLWLHELKAFDLAYSTFDHSLATGGDDMEKNAAQARLVEQAMRDAGDADLLEAVRRMCGYVEDGSSENICITQDDATREWSVYIGAGISTHSHGRARHYHGTSFHQAIRNAALKEIEPEEPQPHGYADQDEAPAVAADAVVEANRKMLLDRSNVGIQKYGVTLDKSGLPLRDFLQHALEESLDNANYLQAAIMKIDQKQ